MSMTDTRATASIVAPLADVTKDPGEPDAAREFRNILVDLDTTARSHPELDVATALARRCGARLRMVDSSLTGRGDGAPIRLLGESRFGSGVPNIPGHDMRSPSDILLREVERSGHDLVVRSRERDTIASGAGRRNEITKRLFRYCRCPVWAVGVRPKLKRPKIVAAVNALTHDRLTEELNVGAIQFALRIANLLDGEIIVLNAWRQPAEERFQGLFTPARFDAMLQTAARGAEDALYRLVDSFGRPLRRCRIELRRGPAERVIPRFVVREGIDIVVAGIRGERGVWPLLFGSTAERLLEATTCSVVSVKAH